MATSTKTKTEPISVDVQRRVAELLRLIKRGSGKSAREMAVLSPHFLRNAPESFVRGYSAPDLLALLSCAYRVMIVSRGQKLSLSVFNPDLQRHGFSSPRTVLQISAPDGPFYVTSVRETLRVMGHTIVHLIHPLVPVSWDSRGRLSELGDPGLTGRQSIIHIEIDRVDDVRELDKIAHAVQQVFDDIGMIVRDFDRMRLVLADVRRKIDAGATHEHSDARELSQFLQWVESGNFVFLGYRQYDVLTKRGRRYYAVHRGSGLGILRRESSSRFTRPVPWSELPVNLRAALQSSDPYVILRSDRVSPIYRRERMINISVKQMDGRGRVIGDHRWVGLFTNRVESLPPTEIPILQQKFSQVVAAEGVVLNSHDYREIYGIFSSYPKDGLFSATVDDLRREVRAAMSAQSARDFKVTFRLSNLGDAISVMVVMAKDKFSREVRLRLEELLRRRLESSAIDYSLAMGTEGGEFARLYFSCFTARKTPVTGTFADLEHEMAEVAKGWTDCLHEELVRVHGARAGHRLWALYGGAFSIEFHSHTPPAGAVYDIARLEKLNATAGPDPSAIEIELFNSSCDSDCSRLKLYHLHNKLILSDIMPVLTAHGLQVIDEVSNSVRVSGRPVAFVHTFRLRQGGKPLGVDKIGAALCESIHGVLMSRLECDDLCSLVMGAELKPREVELVRLYRNFLRQIVQAHPLRSIDVSLVRHPRGARLLFDQFAAKFDPALGDARSPVRARKSSALRAAFERFLVGVDDIIEDRILRLLQNAIDVTVRTNYYRLPSRAALGVKIRSGGLISVPKPVPLFEIFVCAPEFEGVHLRGGMVARGGLRHSDRRDDYRTEVLGLMKTQMVKNAIIVPVGAKGGFYVKARPPKEKMKDVVVSCYRSFIRTLLDVSDNVVGGKVIHPPQVVIHDGPDPYLVVAADKGTATFSDTANAISLERGFWLGDAFASGGENGYDHKVLGITARGAWECVKHHLTTYEPAVAQMEGPRGKPILITCAGIGDLSGDVFGNGMTWPIRLGDRLVLPVLQAAFNHQYIFLDPTPDPLVSAKERARMFRLPRSNWTDYDRRKISAGGGIHPRAAKKIEISRQASEMLGLSSRAVSGEEVVRAILRMKVDLLYNGGIGVYVKAGHERNADVGDSANDRVRINAGELRCGIVGEGGNNGFTQAARIEAARAGIRLNTDAMDNSAGVDMSDHEVNLKILLHGLGQSAAYIRTFLPKLADDVSDAVLLDNELQSRVLSLEQWRSVREIGIYPGLMDSLSDAIALSREIEGLPSDKEISERAARSQGLCRPELAVVLSYVKMALDRSLQERSLQGTRLSSDVILGRFLFEYFPNEVVRRFGRRILKHRLAEQIIATVTANAFVNRAGVTAAFQIQRETGAALADIVRAYFIAEKLLDGDAIRRRIEESRLPMVLSGPAEPVVGDRMPPAVAALDRLEQGLLSVAGWLIREYGVGHMETAIQKFPTLPRMLSRVDAILTASEKKNLQDEVSSVQALGIASDLARRLAGIGFALDLMKLQVAGSRLRNLR